MSALTEVLQELRASTRISGLVGQRMHPLFAPQDSPRPYVVLTEVSDVPEHTLDGLAEDHLRDVRLQVDAYAETYLGAEAIFEAFQVVLGNLHRPHLSARVLDVRRLRDDETGLYRCSADFGVSLGRVST